MRVLEQDARGTYGSPECLCHPPRCPLLASVTLGASSASHNSLAVASVPPAPPPGT